MITARYLGPEKNGLIAALLVYPSLFMSIGSLGIRQSATYFLGKEIYTEDQIKTAITQIWCFTSVFSIIICFLLMYLFSKSGGNLLWVLLALIPIPFSLFNTYNSGIFLGNNDITTFNRINWIPSLIVFLATSLFIILLKWDIPGFLIAMVGGPLFMSAILLFKNKFIDSFSSKFNWRIIKSMLSLGVVYAISLLVISLNYRVDIIILDRLSTPFELGIYSKGAGFSQFLWQVPMVLNTIVFARSAIAKDDLQFSLKLTRLLRLSLMSVGILSVILYFSAHFIILALYGGPFEKSAEVMQILLPGVVILTLFKVMNMDLAGKGKPWISMKAMIPALIMNILLNLVLIPMYGAKGASISSTVSYSVGGILFLYFYSKEAHIPVKEIMKFSISDFEPIRNVVKNILNK
jgi:O-antigen/teichoic acid export membrane protein